MNIKRISIIVLIILVLSGLAIWQSKRWVPSVIEVKIKIHRSLFQKERIPSEKDFQKFLSDNKNKMLYEEFVSYLKQHKLSDVVPPSHLLRQGTDWKFLNMPSHAIPPKKYWKNILPVLVSLRDEIKPAIKDLEVVSGYRSKEYNQKAGGAGKSRHLFFDAVDVIPKSSIARDELHAILLSIWNERGLKHKMGLGLYSKKRFHVDTFRYRKW